MHAQVPSTNSKIAFTALSGSGRRRPSPRDPGEAQAGPHLILHRGCSRQRGSPHPPSGGGNMSAANWPIQPLGSRVLGYKMGHVIPSDFNFITHNSQPENEKETSGKDSLKDAAKSPYSYTQLIIQAIMMSPDKPLTLNGIYMYITKNYPYHNGRSNSTDHNVSWNCFCIKVPCSQEEPGKGSFWGIALTSESKLIEWAFRKGQPRACLASKSL